MSKPIHQPDDFGDYLRESVHELGLSLLDVQREHGIALYKNVLGQERVTREKLDRLLNALPFPPEKKLEINARYEGQDCSTVRSVVIAGVRRHTQELFAERIGISTSAITYILHGDARRREGSNAHEVTWKTWSAIAKAMQLDNFEELNLWRKHMQELLAAEGTPPLGIQAELLLARRPDVSMHKWRTKRPAPFDQMTVRGFQQFIRDLRDGTPHPWSINADLLQVLAAEPMEATGFGAEWLAAVRKNHADRAEELELEAGATAFYAARKELLKQIVARRGPVTRPRRVAAQSPANGEQDEVMAVGDEELDGDEEARLLDHVDPDELWSQEDEHPSDEDFAF